MPAQELWTLQHTAIAEYGREGVIRVDEYIPTADFLQNMAHTFNARYNKHPTTMDSLAGFCNRLEVANIPQLHVYVFGSDATNLSILIRQEPSNFTGSRVPRDMIADISQNRIGPNTLFFAYDTHTNTPMLLARTNDENTYPKASWPHIHAADTRLNNLNQAQKLLIGEMLFTTLFPMEQPPGKTEADLPDLPDTFFIYLDNMEIIDVERTERRSAPIAKVQKTTVDAIKRTEELFIIRQQSPMLKQQMIWRAGDRLYARDIEAISFDLLLEETITFIGSIPMVIRLNTFNE